LKAFDGSNNLAMSRPSSSDATTTGLAMKTRTTDRAIEWHFATSQHLHSHQCVYWQISKAVPFDLGELASEQDEGSTLWLRHSGSHSGSHGGTQGQG